MLKRVIGIIMIVSLFAVIFVGLSVEKGAIYAIIHFSISIGIIGFIVLAVYLIFDESK